MCTLLIAHSHLSRIKHMSTGRMGFWLSISSLSLWVTDSMPTSIYVTSLESFFKLGNTSNSEVTDKANIAACVYPSDLDSNLRDELIPIRLFFIRPDRLNAPPSKLLIQKPKWIAVNIPNVCIATATYRMLPVTNGKGARHCYGLKMNFIKWWSRDAYQ